jgi:hypothetical protein
MTSGLHLCTWGSISPIDNKLNVSLGLPPSALSMVGLNAVEDSDMLVIPVGGTTSSPRVDWVQ